MDFFNIERVNDNAIMPVRKHHTDAGYDLASPCDIELPPGETVVVDTGLRIGLRAGYEGQIRPRSSMWADGVVAMGTIDAGYRGTINIILRNLNGTKRGYTRGDRVAQLVVNELPRFNLVEGGVDTDTVRGEGGLGSTGR